MKQITVFLFMVMLLLISCGEETSPQTVPYAPVNLRIYPFSYDAVLNNPLTYKIFTEENRRLEIDRFGFAGVLVVSDAVGKIYAFDLCCPHEDSKTIKVSPEYQDGGRYSGKVKCPSCGTVFVTMFGFGNVESGPAKENLQQYKVMPYDDGSYKILH